MTRLKLLPEFDCYINETCRCIERNINKTAKLRPKDVQIFLSVVTNLQQPDYNEGKYQP